MFWWILPQICNELSSEHLQQGFQLCNFTFPKTVNLMQPAVGKNVLLVLVVWSKIHWRLWKDSGLCGSWFGVIVPRLCALAFLQKLRNREPAFTLLPAVYKRKRAKSGPRALRLMSYPELATTEFSLALVHVALALPAVVSSPFTGSPTLWILCSAYRHSSLCPAGVGYVCIFVWNSWNWDFE